MGIGILLFILMLVALTYLVFTYYGDNQYVKYISDNTNRGINYISEKF